MAWSDPPVSAATADWTGTTDAVWTGFEGVGWSTPVVASGYGQSALVNAGNPYGLKKSTGYGLTASPTVGNAYGFKGGTSSPSTASPSTAQGYGTDNARGWVSDQLVSTADGTYGEATHSSQATTVAVAASAGYGAKAADDTAATVLVQSTQGYGVDSALGRGAIRLFAVGVATFDVAEHSSQAVTDLIHSIVSTPISNRSGVGTDAEITISTAARGFNGNIYWDEDPGYWGDDPGTWPSEVAKFGVGATVLVHSGTATTGTSTRTSSAACVVLAATVGYGKKTAAARANTAQVTVAASTGNKNFARQGAIAAPSSILATKTAGRIGNGATTVIAVGNVVKLIEATGYASCALISVASSTGTRRAIVLPVTVGVTGGAAYGHRNAAQRALAAEPVAGAATGVVAKAGRGADPQVHVVAALFTTARTSRAQTPELTSIAGVAEAGKGATEAAATVLLLVGIATGVQTDTGPVVITLAAHTVASLIALQVRADLIQANTVTVNPVQHVYDQIIQSFEREQNMDYIEAITIHDREE